MNTSKMNEKQQAPNVVNVIAIIIFYSIHSPSYKKSFSKLLQIPKRWMPHNEKWFVRLWQAEAWKYSNWIFCSFLSSHQFQTLTIANC